MQQSPAEKDDKGHWQIDPSELSRWMFANPFPNGRENQYETPEETHENSAWCAEVKMLREQINAMTVERDRERGQLWACPRSVQTPTVLTIFEKRF